jgi:hypothetical protein
VSWLNIYILLTVCENIIWIFLAIPKTGRRYFSVSLLNLSSGGLDFTWISRPPHG